MARYNIYAGLGGGFGGASYQGTISLDSELEAEKVAYDCAVDIYESYAGSHGLVDIGEIEENPEEFGLEDGYTEQELYEVYTEEMENWLVYYVLLTSGDNIPEDELEEI